MSPYIVKDYEAGDEQEIIATFERVFGKTMGPSESSRHWNWEYRERPRKELEIKLAWSEGDLAGQYATVPTDVRICGHTMRASLSLDTMTDPGYRGQGVFIETASALYRTLSERGTKLVYGFPNSQSVGGFVKRLGWDVIMPAPVHLRPLRLAFLTPRFGSRDRKARLRGGWRTGRGTFRDRRLELNEETCFGEWADALWNILRDDHSIMTVRDRRYLRWRYELRPETQYRITSASVGGLVRGFAVCTIAKRAIGEVLFVMDTMFESNSVGRALVSDALAYGRVNNCVAGCALISPGSKHRSVFRQCGFFKLPKRLFPQDLHFGGRSLSPSVPRALMRDKRAWHLSWGDTDVL